MVIFVVKAGFYMIDDEHRIQYAYFRLSNVTVSEFRLDHNNLSHLFIGLLCCCVVGAVSCNNCSCACWYLRFDNAVAFEWYTGHLLLGSSRKKVPNRHSLCRFTFTHKMLYMIIVHCDFPTQLCISWLFFLFLHR